MRTEHPQRTRTYLNHHLDSRRWDLYAPHAGDVVVSTAYKAGTTWTQAIVLALLDPHGPEVVNVSESSPWPDRRFGQDETRVREMLSRRVPGRPMCLKTHLPLDGLPYYSELRYLVVGRDPRDVFMSLHNHYSNYNDLLMSHLNDAERVGPALPPCPQDPRELWRAWTTRGWFEWESEGWPFWGNLSHTASWWRFRQLANVQLMHYGEMWAEPHRSVARIAQFIGVDADEAAIDRVVARTGFEFMKRNADGIQARMNHTWHGGAKAFFHCGGGGRWSAVLDDDDLALYEAAKQRVLEPTCAKWLEQGGHLA